MFKFKISNINVFLVLFLSVFLVLTLPLNVFSLNIGANPVTHNFNNLLRGGYAEEYFKVYSTTSDSVYFGIDSLNQSYNISSWLKLITPNGEEIKLGKENVYKIIDGKLKIKIEVNLPSDIPNGNYKARVMFYGTETLDSEGLTTLSLMARGAIDLNFRVSDEQFIKCDVKDFKMTSVEKGNPSYLTFFLRNWGNVLFEPKVSLKIFDNNRKNLIKELTLSGNIYNPTEYRYYNASISTDDLRYGQYWVEINIPKCDFVKSEINSALVNFDVFEPGMQSAKGIITGVSHKTKLMTGEKVPISLKFKNTGEVTVLAYSEVNVYFNDELIDKLKSDKLNVKPGEEQEFVTFFSPKKKGVFYISMLVKYDKKQTFPIKDKILSFGEDLIDVYQKYEEPNNHWFITISVSILIIIFLFLVMIKKKKNRRHKDSYF